MAFFVHIPRDGIPDLNVDAEDDLVDDDDDGGIVDDGLEMEDEDEDEGVEEARGPGRRGKDLPWETRQEFATKEAFEASEIPAELATNFSIRSGKFSNIETYYCRFSRKKGYKCQIKMRVRYSESSDQVFVEGIGEDHTHELMADYQPAPGNENYLRWTEAQTKVVMTGVMNEASPTVIKRLLREEFAEGKMPSAGQIANKIAHCKKIIMKSKNMLSTGEMRRYANSRVDIPLDKHEMYVAFHEIIDSQEEENIRFTLILTTEAMKDLF